MVVSRDSKWPDRADRRPGIPNGLSLKRTQHIFALEFVAIRSIWIPESPEHLHCPIYKYADACVEMAVRRVDDVQGVGRTRPVGKQRQQRAAFEVWLRHEVESLP